VNQAQRSLPQGGLAGGQVDRGEAGRGAVDADDDGFVEWGVFGFGHDDLRRSPPACPQ
jgi:hypothetical protein